MKTVDLFEGGLKATINDRLVIFENDSILCEGTCEFVKDSKNNNAYINLFLYRDKRKNKTYRSRRYSIMQHMEKWFYSQCCKLKELGHL